MQAFDLLKAPLIGNNLIEASAGTGKTYNIEGLFIRLVVEMELQIDQILVLTFTNAATEELKDRIRNKLVQARDAFAARSSVDPLIASLVNTYPDLKAAGKRLQEALIDFDQAAIYTIHGFCQRIGFLPRFAMHDNLCPFLPYQCLGPFRDGFGHHHDDRDREMASCIGNRDAGIPTG